MTTPSPAEQTARIELAALYHLAVRYKWTDLIYTHFSARIPGTDELLINPFGLQFHEVTASKLIKIDPEGRILDDPTGLGINFAGFVIHGCIHEARPEINFVLHTHTRAGIAVSAQKHGLLPLSQHACRIHSGLTYHDFQGIALDLAEREQLVADLGPDSKAMILRNHGLLALGLTAAEAFDIHYYLDAACQIQIDALSAGIDNVLLVPKDVDERTRAQFERPQSKRVGAAWDTLLRQLDADKVPYKD